MESPIKSLARRGVQVGSVAAAAGCNCALPETSQKPAGSR